MPNGFFPTYEYRPRISKVRPSVRTCSSIRARLWAGGTYFRAREPGLQGNRLSIEVVQLEPPSASGGEGYCIVTNEVPTRECVHGNLIGSLLELQGTYEDLWIFKDLNTTPIARNYIISLRIAFSRQTDDTILPPLFETEISAPYSKLLTSGKLSVKPLPGPLPNTSETVAFIAPRTRIYKLSVITITPPPESVGAGVTYGFDIDDLRQQINDNDPWVEMIERTEAPVGGGPISPALLNDAFDKEQDDPALMPFVKTNLTNGNGLPASPSFETTGPARSIVHMNYGEDPKGVLKEVNLMYEWAGESAIAGSWVSY